MSRRVYICIHYKGANQSANESTDRSSVSIGEVIAEVSEWIYVNRANNKSLQNFHELFS